MLTRPALLDLRRSIEDAAGREVAEEVLFRLGQRWGKSEAGLVSVRDGERVHFEEGLRRLGELGLGMAWLDTYEHDAESRDLCIVGHVLDPLEVWLAQQDGRKPAGTICGLTVGYLTGLAGGLSGLDVVCSPFSCREECLSDECVSPGCRFELRPAHALATPAPRAPAPSGSARFFLRALGASFGGGDISLEDLLENTGDAVILIDTEDVIRFWNCGAESMFGYKRDEVVGRKVGFIVPADLIESDELGWIQEQIESQGRLQNLVTRRVPKEGPELSVSLTRTVLHDSQGKVIGSTAIIRDVTEQLRTEDALHTARNMALVGEMAATVAHEIKNPLAGIYAAVQYLSRSLETEGEPREILENVGAEIRRLDETVHDLLRFARPLPPRPAPIEIGGFVRDLFTGLEHHPDVARHELRFEAAAECTLSVDTEMLRQSLLNLILNAAQAMEEPGLIRVGAEERDEEVLVTVSDTGPGIPAEVCQTLFDPFITSKTRGTGLGLSIARKNAEAHGGTLELVQSDGAGTEFRLGLPREPAG